jgi:hypothetical protein
MRGVFLYYFFLTGLFLLCFFHVTELFFYSLHFFLWAKIILFFWLFKLLVTNAKRSFDPSAHVWAPKGPGALYLMNPIRKTCFFGIFFN